MIDKAAGETGGPMTGLETHRGHGKTILVVDDEAPVLNLAGKILAGLNYTVLVAQTPEKALDLVRSHGGDIHLLLCDVVMPEMSGKELAEEIAELQPNTRILFMSGYRRISTLHHRVMESGVHFIQKPFTPDALARKVREAMGSE